MSTTLSTATLAATLCATAAVAHAGTGPERDVVSPGVATGLSVGATAASWGAIALGFSMQWDDAQDGGSDVGGALIMAGGLGTFLGPSLGQAYAGHLLTPGLGLRAAGVVAALGGAAAALDACPISFLADSPCEDSAAATILLTTGALAYVGGTALDLATAGRNARAYNRRVRDLAITPTAHKDGAGLVVAGRF